MPKTVWPQVGRLLAVGVAVLVHGTPSTRVGQARSDVTPSLDRPCPERRLARSQIAIVSLDAVETTPAEAAFGVVGRRFVLVVGDELPVEGVPKMTRVPCLPFTSQVLRVRGHTNSDPTSCVVIPEATPLAWLTGLLKGYLLTSRQGRTLTSSRTTLLARVRPQSLHSPTAGVSVTMPLFLNLVQK